MFNEKNVDIYYFSGTGNTLLILRHIKEVFLENNINLRFFKIEKSNPQEVNLDNILGFFFPVAMQSTFPFIRRFLRNLPSTDKQTPVFLVDTLHTYSGLLIGPLGKQLEKKGYRLLASKEIKMPGNFIPDSNKEHIKAVIEKGKKEAEEFAYSLIEGKAKWQRQTIFADIFASLFSEELSQFFLYKSCKWFFSVDETKCVKCGICAKICPVDNIKLQPYPLYLNKCQFCQRCFAFCPEDAIVNKLFKGKQKYKAVELKDILAKQP